MYRPPHRARPGRGLKIVTVILAIGLIAAVASLIQTRRQLAGLAGGATMAGPTGVSDDAAGAEEVSVSLVEGGAGDAPPLSLDEAITPSVAAFPPSGSGDPVPATDGFLRVGRPGVDYTAAYVVDRGSGRVLYEHNAHTPVPTASMAKMMTSLITMEEIDAGRLTLDDPVTISARSAGMGGSQIYAAQGQVFSVQTLLAATMVQSANDAATALAEKIAGSNEAFAERMNRRARELGLERSTFFDPHGLPSPGRENLMTARDLAVLGNELMRYPLMREYAATSTFPFENATFTAGMTNPNFLLRQYDGAYGIKTGYTASAGFSITAAARRGDTDVIAVVTGAATSRGRLSSFELAGRMIDEVFLSWSTVIPMREGDSAGEVVVGGGAVASVGALAARDISLLLPRGDASGVEWTLEPRPLEAPVSKGDTVGTVIVVSGGTEVARAPALAADSVDRRPWWRFWGG